MDVFKSTGGYQASIAELCTEACAVNCTHTAYEKKSDLCK